jgi:hypothetical protein
MIRRIQTCNQSPNPDSTHEVNGQMTAVKFTRMIEKTAEDQTIEAEIIESHVMTFGTMTSTTTETRRVLLPLP